MLHWLQFAAGLVLSASWRGTRLRRHAVVASLAVAAGLAYVLAVHLPPALDLAARYPILHAGLHGGFLVAGAVVGAAWRDVAELGRILLVIIAMGAMTVISLAEISGAFAYATYPSDQEAASGIVMLAGMGLFWVALAFADVPGRLSRQSHPLASGITAAVVVCLIGVSYRVV